jgi:microcystin-dependent protein
MLFKKLALLALLTLPLPGLAQEFIGEIRATAYNFAPRNWAMCNGQTIPIVENSALFSLLGTYYGGDGRTTFALPNLQGRLVFGPETNELPGETGGEASHTLALSELPAHNHQLFNPPFFSFRTVQGTGTANTAGPAYSYATAVDARGNTVLAYTLAAKDGTVANPVVGYMGGSQAHNNMPPYTVVNYIICLYGLYPSRP